MKIFSIIKEILHHRKMSKEVEAKIRDGVKGIKQKSKEIRDLTIDHDLFWFRGKHSGGRDDKSG